MFGFILINIDRCNVAQNISILGAEGRKGGGKPEVNKGFEI